MDNIAHTLAGLAVRDVAPKRLFESRAFFWVALLVANLPDIDIVLWLFGQSAYFEFHRGLSHSLLLVPVWGLIGAVIAYFASRRRLPFSSAWLWYSIIVVVHLCLDWVTSYGTELFAPFDRTTYSARLFPIMDIWVILASSVLVFAGRFYSQRRRIVAVAVIAAIFAYAGFRVVAKFEAERMVLENRAPVEKVMSFADIESWRTWVNPSIYRVVTVNGDSAVSYEASPIGGLIKEQNRFDLFSPGDRFWDEAMEHDLARVFLKRSELPIKAEKGNRLLVSDLRYTSDFDRMGTLVLVFPLENGRIAGEPRFARPEFELR